MKTVMAIIIAPLILLSSAWASGVSDEASPPRRIGVDARHIMEWSAKAVPVTAALAVKGAEYTVHSVTSLGSDVPRHASHAPRMAVHASNKGVSSAKAKATEGVIGFNTISSFFLRIASSSFWALVSGILRY